MPSPSVCTRLVMYVEFTNHKIIRIDLCLQIITLYNNGRHISQ